MSEQAYLEARQTREVSKAAWTSAARRGARSVWDDDEARVKLIGTGASLAGSAALAGAVVAGQSYHGGHLRQMANEEFEMTRTGQNQFAERARARAHHFKPAGNNVYAKERRFFTGNSKEYVRQTVAANRGSKNKIYVETKYPRAMLGGATYPHSDERLAYVVAHPRLNSRPKAKLATSYVAHHEHQHVKDFAGRNGDKALFDRAVRSAQSKYPKGKNFRQEYLTGRAFRRAKVYGESLTAARGEFEGRADATAARKHRIQPHLVTGYPEFAAVDPHFARGYVKGGGLMAPTDPRELREARRDFKRRANQTYGKKQARR
jgi:hypothetical protein